VSEGCGEHVSDMVVRNGVVYVFTASLFGDEPRTVQLL